MSAIPRGPKGRLPAGRRQARPGGPGTSRATRPGAGRSGTRPPVAGQPSARRPESSSRRPGLTGRAAILALVACALVVSAALPLRELFSQRGEIGRLEQDQSQAQARVDALEAEKTRLADPAYAAAEARRRLHFVLPGETSYVLILPTPDPGALAAGSVGSGSDAPWYSQVWGSVEIADSGAEPAPSNPAPTPVPSPAPAPAP